MKSSKMIRRTFAGILSALMILSPASAFADDDGVVGTTEECITYDDAAYASLPSYAWVTPISSTMEVGGHIDIPKEVQEYEPDPLESYSATVQQPFYFALGEGVGTYAKDQGQWGTCWAFSVTGAAESSLIAQGRTFNKGTPANASNIDLSELHTAYFFYNTETDPLGNMQNDRSAIIGETYLTGGGNNMLTSMALMAWKGMALESLCPYGAATSAVYPVDQSLAHKEAAHCRNMYWINMRDINLVKSMIIKYGGVVISYNHESAYYSSYYKSFYSPQVINYNGHSVYIVGWNDNYPAAQYPMAAPGNGAWIVKNSWGRNWGMTDNNSKGCYWMSYHDPNLRRKYGVVLDYEDADNFDNNYQYDGTGGINSLSIPASASDPTRLGNQFEVKASDYERLEAVSVAFEQMNVNYSVQIYKKNNNSMLTAPDDGIPMLDTPVTGKTEQTGYYTIPLNKELVFRKGEVYSIVISIWHDSGNAMVFVDMNDYDNDWIHFVNQLEYGQSWFAWGQNAAWAELSNYVFPLNTSYRGGYTLRIKGYTDNVAPVTYDISGLTVDGTGYARLGKPFSANLITDTVLPETIDVFMSGVLLTEGTSYSYDNATGTVSINNVNGPVNIVASVAVHEHTWDEGVITTEPTCGAAGVKTYTCTVCGETREEPVPATGIHTWDGGVVTVEPTTESTGVMTYTCTVCGAARTEDIPKLSTELAVAKTGSYDVKITGLDNTKAYLIRYATGVYSNASAVKNGTNAGFVQVSGVYETTITLPTSGIHTVLIQTGGSSVYFDYISINADDIRDHLVASANELNLKVENLEGASYVKLYQNGAAVLTVAAKNFSTDGLKTWADIAVPAAGAYTVRVAYADGGIVEGDITLTAPEASVVTNGRILALSNYGGSGNVSFIRLAKGSYSTAKEIKAASDLRTFGAKYFKDYTAAFAALDAVNGETTEYTVQIGYVSGYTQFITFEITPTVPVITATSDSIVLSNVLTASYFIDWVRCAPGVQTSLSGVRHARGSQVKKTADIVDDTISFTGLTAGSYTLYYLYDGWNLSEGMVTVTVSAK